MQDVLILSWFYILIVLLFPIIQILIKMKTRMEQAEIDALLNDSMFKDSQLSQSHALSKKDNTKKTQEVQQKQQGQSYGGQQFQSYQESKRFQKNDSKNNFQDGKKLIKPNTKLEEIQQQNIVNNKNRLNQPKKSLQKQKAKTGIYFYPPKPTTNQGHSAQKKQVLPYNYSRLQQRQKELLLTTLTQQNKQLKESMRVKDNDYKKLQNIYKVLLQQKSQNAPSVKEITLQKQLATLSSKYEKLQNLCKLEKQKATFKLSKTKQSFIPEHRVNDRQEQLLDIIDKLKQRLTSTNNQLKTLQNKMNQGDNYVDELKRKLKRIEQLQYKMDKMTQQAQNDREFIEVLKDKNKKLENDIYERQKEKKNMQVQIRRWQLGQATQTDTAKQLAEVRKEKEKLQSHLRDITSNLIKKVNPYSRQTNNIQDSGQLLNP